MQATPCFSPEELPAALYRKALAKASMLGLTFDDYLASVIRKEIESETLQPDNTPNERST